MQSNHLASHFFNQKETLMNTITRLLAVSAIVLAPISVGFAQQPATSATTSVIASADMTDGEIRKIDKDAKKITIKHGEIKNLDMPPMTMVFQVKDAAMLDMIQAGDKVKFKVEKRLGNYVVTDLQLAK
jgi:Cu(I)/Ag(I) efflux system periplasmic protein CusF